MTENRSFLRRYQLAAYFILAFAISRGAILILIGPSGLPATADQAQTIGMALLLGPVHAMLIMTALAHGRGGFHELWRRLKRWRFGGGHFCLCATCRTGFGDEHTACVWQR